MEETREDHREVPVGDAVMMVDDVIIMLGNDHLFEEEYEKAIRWVDGLDGSG